MEAVQNNTVPYVGPRPFEAKESGVFFGRGIEVNELVSLITAHPVVVLYAQSGAGKTSLIRAGLIPVLVNEEKFDVLPPMRVREQVTPTTNLANIENVYMFNALAGARHAKDGGLVSNAFGLEGLGKMSLSDFLRERTIASGEVDAFRPTVVIIDQFEEIFTLYPEYWEQRQSFFEQVAAALGRDPLLRVLFSMREDFIAELDPYASCLPEKLRTRFRIERLNRRTGLAAITEPLQAVDQVSGGVKFAPGADEELINNLLMVKVKTAEGNRNVKGKFIEPLQLQVVCQTIWNNLRRNDKLITHEHLMAFGDVDKALSIFYETAIAKTADVCGVKESVLRRWCQDKLITPAGTRATVFRGSKETAGLKNDAVAELEKQSLFRVELRGGAQWYELTHDRFVEVIQQSNQKWILERPAAEQTLLRLEEKAQEWGQDRDDSRLLDEVELLEAERWLTASEAELEPSKDLLALVRESRKAIEERRQEEAEQRLLIEDRARAATRLRWLAYILTGVSLLAMIALGYAIYKARQFNQLLRDAEQSKAQIEVYNKQLQDTYNELVKANTNLDLSNLANRARNNLAAGKFMEAETDYNSLLNSYKQQDNKKGISEALKGLANVYSSANYSKASYKKAIAYFEDAKKALGNDAGLREDVGWILCDEGQLYIKWAEAFKSDQKENDELNKYKDAMKSYYEAMKKFEKNSAGAKTASDGYKDAKERYNSIVNNPFRSTQE